jgi:WD40 repeat protein
VAWRSHGSKILRGDFRTETWELPFETSSLLRFCQLFHMSTGRSLCCERRASHTAGSHQAPVSALQFDNNGDLLVACTLSGRIAVHDFMLLRHAASQCDDHTGYAIGQAMRLVHGVCVSVHSSIRPSVCLVSRKNNSVQQPVHVSVFLSVYNNPSVCYRIGGSFSSGVEPLLLIDTGRKLESVRWHPMNENVVATAASLDRQVHLYDLQYCQVTPAWQNQSAIHSHTTDSPLSLEPRRGSRPWWVVNQ